MPPHKHPIRTPEELEDIERYSGSSDGYTSHYLETEIDGERVGLTLWDSTGLERSIVDIQLRGVTGFLEGKFEETLREETKVVRSPGVRDTHIHCTFLVLDPVRLDENIAAAERAAQGNPKASDSPVVGILDKYLDLQVLRTVLGKTTVVPIISKADTITTAHMAYLRKAVWDSLKKANIDPLEVLTLEDQEEYTSSESADEEVITETQTDHVPVPERVPEPVPEDVSEVEQNGESGNGEQGEQDGEDGEQDEAANGDEAKEAVEPSGEESAENAEKEAEETEKAEAAEKLAEEEAAAAAAELSRKSGFEAVAQNLPFAILSPDPHTLASDDEPIGRRFAWGFADPYNPEHCDFVKLKNSVFSDWRSELREASRVIWYENWRTSLLNHNGVNVVPQKKTFGGRSAPFDGRRTR